MENRLAHWPDFLRPLRPGERAWRPGTQIIDGNSFLGAATRTLLEGLKRSPRMGVFECARAQLLRYVGCEAEALDQLGRVLREHADHEAPMRFAREIESHIANGWPPRRA